MAHQRAVRMRDSDERPPREQAPTPVQETAATDAPSSPSLRRAALTSRLDAEGDPRASELRVMRGFESYKVHTVELELREGDTLVFVDFLRPLRKPSVAAADCAGFGYQDQKFRVHSQRLLDTGSSKFAEMFGPTYQFRVQRRRKVVNNLPLGVKYVLDLTPPTEGDELVFQMTELSLTPGITEWWSSHLLHGAPADLVTGHDDVCSCWKGTGEKETIIHPQVTVELSDPSRAAHTDTFQAIPSAERMLQLKAKGVRTIYNTPAYRKIPDYCSIRHCNGIIRLLMMIEDHQVKLDSAAKVWTLVALAKIFDCTATIQKAVETWIYTETNNKFIEVLPEEALEIANALQLPEVMECAFRILVNELALAEAEDKEQPQRKNGLTVFGRRCGENSDELKNIIQHAARTLVERIPSFLTQFENPNVLDSWDDDEWNRLRGIHSLLSTLPQDDEPVAQALTAVSHLIDSIPRAVDELLKRAVDATTASYSLMTTFDKDRSTYVEPRHFRVTNHILKDFNPVQRLLTSSPYMRLNNDLEYNLFWQKGRSLPPPLKSVPSLGQDARRHVETLLKQRPEVAEWSDWGWLLDRNLGNTVPWSDVELEPTLINLNKLDWQIRAYLRDQIQDARLRNLNAPMNLTRHLMLRHLMLDLEKQPELKFLPLWAGGLNDGTGSVFEPELPPAEMGPNGPGPSYHTGATIPSAPGSISSSLMDDIAAMKVEGSTTAGSVDVHDSISVVYKRDKVIADDVSIQTESFTEGSSDFEQARFKIPAEHQSISQAMVDVVEADSVYSEPTTTEQIWLGGEYGDEGEDDDFDDATETASSTGKDALSEDGDCVMVDIKKQ